MELYVYNLIQFDMEIQILIFIHVLFISNDMIKLLKPYFCMYI